MRSAFLLTKHECFLHAHDVDALLTLFTCFLWLFWHKGIRLLNGGDDHDAHGYALFHGRGHEHDHPNERKEGSKHSAHAHGDVLQHDERVQLLIEFKVHFGLKLHSKSEFRHDGDYHVRNHDHDRGDDQHGKK